MYKHIYEAKLAETIIKLIHNNKDNENELKSIEDLSFYISGMLNGNNNIISWFNLAEVCDERIVALKNNKSDFNDKLLNQCKDQLKEYLNINVAKEDYNLPLSDKKEIINRFINFTLLNVVRSAKVSPDKRLTLFIIDNIKYVLDETDYFVDYYDASDITEMFGISEVHWIMPKEEFRSGDANYISANGVYYGFAKVI